MRNKGTLAKWNDDRGFGFITPVGGGPDVFVHISAFPRGGDCPRLGETLTFEVQTAGDGKTRAVGVSRPGGDAPSQTRSRAPGSFGSNRPFVTVPLVLLIVAGIVAVTYQRISSEPGKARASSGEATAGDATPGDAQENSQFKCDGRTHCSQMTSCAEARYFLDNCPGVQMDGNGDGEPCERQWCDGGQ